MTDLINSNVLRINAALASDKTSGRAREYLDRLISAHGSVEAVAALTHEDGIGVSVLEAEAGTGDYVHYGNYSDSTGDYDCAFCCIADVLDVIEDSDAVPGWYDTDCVLVTVKTSGAYGYETKSRGQVNNDS